MRSIKEIRKQGVRLLAIALAMVMLFSIIPLGFTVAEEGVAIEPAATNLLPGGDFLIPMGGAGSPWTAQIISPGAAGPREIITAGPDAPSQRVPVTAAGTANWHLMFHQNFNFVSGVEYAFYFTARASVARSMDFQLSEPFVDTRVNLTTEWQTFGPFTIGPHSVDTVRQLSLVLGPRSGGAAPPFIAPPAGAHDVFFREARLVATNDPGPGACGECGYVECECPIEGWEGRFGHENAIREIRRPVAGIFPNSAYRNPFRDNMSGNVGNNGFHQTLIWYPAVEHAFLTNTEYTVTILLEPNARWTNEFPGVSRNFEANGISHLNIGGLPTEGVRAIRTEYGTVGSDGTMSIIVEFEATGSQVQPADLIFFDDFTGTAPAGRISSGFFRAPQWIRQDMSDWSNSMSNIETRDEETYLVLSWRRDNTRAPANATELQRDSWITAGAVRSRAATGSDIAFESAFGYYEARIKFPAVTSMWGAFWLMTPNWVAGVDGRASARMGSEIDIIESFHYGAGRQAYGAAHWRTGTTDGWGTGNFSWAQWRGENDNPEWGEGLGFNIFDGEFHTFSLEWTPNEYIYRVNGVEYARFTRDVMVRNFGMGNPAMDIAGKADIMQNANYMKLSVEAAQWANDTVPEAPGIAFFDPELEQWLAAHAGEMLVDYVKVWNGPRPADVEPSDFMFEVRDIGTPVAGHFPSSMYRLGLRPGHARSFDGGGQNFGYDLTLRWDPPVERYFLPNTVYTAELIMEPNNRWHYTEFWPRDNWGVPQSPANVGEANALPWTRVYNDIPLNIPPHFANAGVDHTRVANLPTEGVANITSSHVGANLHVFITFEPTEATLQEAVVIFHDDFTNPTNDAPYTPGLGAPGSPSSFVSELRQNDENGPASGFARATPNLWRQDLSYWCPEMSWICEERDLLVLGYQRSPDGFDKHCPDWMVQWVIPPGQLERSRNNTIRAGGVRTMSQDWEAVYFENAFGFYEANIAFGESLPGTWGAFWLMNRYKAYAPTYSVRGQEIDIIESIHGYQNPLGRFNFNLFWNTTDSFSRGEMVSSGQGGRSGANVVDVNIYDGGFHTIALEWSPTDYIFFVNGIEVGRFSELQPRNGMAINQNPNYMKLSMEAARWALPGGANGTGNLPAILNEVQEMLVDYVTVWNGPRPAPATNSVEINDLYNRAGDLVADDFDTVAQWNAYRRARENVQTVINSPLVEQWLIDRIAKEFRATIPVDVLTVEFNGTNPNRLVDALVDNDVILNTRGNLGIFPQHSTFTIPAGRILTVETALNAQRGAEIVVEGTLVIADIGRLNNQGGGTIRVAPGGRLIIHGWVENVTGSTFTNAGDIIITEIGRLNIRAGVSYCLACGTVDDIGILNINRDANRLLSGCTD